MKNNIKNYVVALLFAFLPFHLFAQSESRQLSLKEAINLSLANNKSLKLSQAKAQEATANYHEISNNRLPDVKVSGSYLRVNNPDVKLKVKTGSGSGGSGGDASATPKVDQVVYGLANVTLPFFSGFKLKYAIEATRYLEKASQLDVEADKEEVIQNTINAYGNLYKSLKTIKLIEQNLQQQQQRVQDFSNLEKNGLLARNELLKAQLQYSNVELAILDAESNYRLTYMHMNLMLGLPEQTVLIPDSFMETATLPTSTLAAWKEKAMINRKELAALTLREKAAESGIKATKGEYYPGLAVTGGYVAADIRNLLTVTNAVNIGLGLQYNISSIWKTGAKLEVDRARLHQVQITQGIVADQVHLEVNRAYEQHLLSVKKVDVFKRAIEQANENYRITKNKYDNNLVTTTDLLEADYTQLQANINYTFAVVDAMVSFKKLEQVAGIINEHLSK